MAASSPTTPELLRDAAERAVRYLDGLGERPVAPVVAGVERFRESFPEAPSDPRETLRLLDEVGGPATMAMAGPRFFGFVIGGSLPVTVAANWLSTAWDQNTGLYVPTPGAATIEDVALGWLLDLLGLPPSTGAGFVTGATVANFTCLAAARHVVFERVGWDVEADGLIGAPPIHILVGEEAHPTLLKSLGLLGLGRSHLTRIPVDAQGRMRADQIPTVQGPALICAQAGNVNSGAFDPFEEIAARAKELGAWLHVDGAFGLWAAAAPERRGLVRGLALADSWATDAHKTLNVPYDSGIAFVKDAHALRASMAIHAAYLPTQTPGRNPSDYTPELSRRARGIEVWAALRSLGRTGVATLVEGMCRHATRFARRLTEAGFEVLNEVVFNQVVVAFGDAARTERTIAEIQRDGTCWAGETMWRGRRAMRLSVSSWATTAEDVERSADAIIRAAHVAAKP